MTTVSPAVSPLTISVEVSPLSPATTGTVCDVPFFSTVTRAFWPEPVTAALGTWRTLSRSLTVTETFAVMPALIFVLVRSSANVTPYWTTPEDDVPVASIDAMCAASWVVPSAEIVTVAGSPIASFAASLSANGAVTSIDESPISVTKPDDEDPDPEDEPELDDDELLLAEETPPPAAV